MLRLLRGTAIFVASALLLTEGGLHLVLGNFSVDRLYEYGPGDGRCIGLRPSAMTDYTGWLFRIPPVHLAVNVDGYRGPRRSKAKAEGRYRILLLGDSFAFGQAVPERDTISAQLETILRRCGSRRVEVLNFGVPGLNMEEVLDQYVRFAGEWTHDLALYVAFKNDLDAPLCRAHRRYGLLNSTAFQRLNQYLYLSRLVYISYMLAATKNETSDPSAPERLRVAEERFAAEARRRGAKLGIIMLGDPLLKQLPGGPPWVPAVPMLDVSPLLDPPHVVSGEFHLNALGDRILATRAATWIEDNFCPGQ